MTDAALDNLDTSASDQTVVDTNIIDTQDSAAIVAPQTWPDDWRRQMAGDDEKENKRLERMKSPADLFKSYRELEKLKSSYTPPPKAPGKDATPEEVKAYRDQIGVPESHDKYDLSFDDGTVIGEDIRPHFDGFLKYAHENNMSPDQVKGIAKFYMADIANQQQQVKIANDEARVNGLADLKSEWGGEFKGNINAIQSLFVDAPEGTMDRLMSAAGADGLKFANNPDNIRWLVSLAKTINPVASLLPSGITDESSIDTELDKLKSQMTSKDPAEQAKYWKDPKAQERYQALVQAKSKSR